MPYTLEQKLEMRQAYVNRERARIEAERKLPDFDTDAIARAEKYLDEIQAAIDAKKAEIAN
jgi:hypothetical protein